MYPNLRNVPSFWFPTILNRKPVKTASSLNYVSRFSSYRIENSVSVLKTIQLIDFREIIAVYSEIRTKYINSLCGHCRCVFSKPCTKLTLHCNHRSGHLKTEHTESLFLLRRHLGNLPRGPAVSMRSELLVAHEKLGQLLLLLLTVYFVPM